MKPLEYGGNQKIGSKEILWSIPSWIIAEGLLTIPRSVVSVTESSDGWISILIAGAAAILLCWVTISLGFQFPNQTFVQYSAQLVYKPAAYVLTLFIAVIFLLWVSYETRAVANIAVLYLFSRTPLEIVALVFLLVLIYAVSGSREGVFRLNVLFMPIIAGISLLALGMNIGFMEISNLKPFMVTEWKEVLAGTKESVFSFVGFEFLLFYIPLMNQTKKAFKLAVIGIGIPTVLYMLFFIVSIGSLGVEVTKNVMYPTVELAKNIELPATFIERFESLFFTIWVMKIFGTALIAYDVGLLALQSLIPRVNKINFIIVLSPLIYLIAMLPKDINQFFQFGIYLGYIGVVSSCFIPTSLLLIAKIKRKRLSGQQTGTK